MTQADFLTAPLPDPTDLEDLDLTGPGRFYNRELSWLGFNWRVLEEAENPRVPLLERIRFLSISATNLDEFYTVRVAGLRELAHGGHTTTAADGLTPAEQLVLINENARRLLDAQQRCFAALRTEMAAENITILDRATLTDPDLHYLSDVFLNKVFPVLSPLAVDPAHPFPFIPNLGRGLIFDMTRISDGESVRQLVMVPSAVQSPPAQRPSATSTAGPPSSGTLRTFAPDPNATHWPSGERNCRCPPSLPGIAVNSRRSSVRWNSRRPPSCSAETTTRLPSRDKASDG